MLAQDAVRRLCCICPFLYEGVNASTCLCLYLLAERSSETVFVSLQAPSGKLDHFLPVSDFTFASMREALLAEYSSALSQQNGLTETCQAQQSCTQAKRTVNIQVTAGRRDFRCSQSSAVSLCFFTDPVRSLARKFYLTTSSRQYPSLNQPLSDAQICSQPLSHGQAQVYIPLEVDAGFSMHTADGFESNMHGPAIG